MNVEMFKMMGAAGASNASCLGVYTKVEFCVSELSWLYS